MPAGAHGTVIGMAAGLGDRAGYGPTSVNIVAYGSLMCRGSLESALGRPAALTKVTVPGWRRVFNAAFGEYAYLNLRPDPGAAIEAAYFEMDAAELPRFAEREAGSELTEVAPGYLAFVWPEAHCRELPVLSSYVAICRRGAAELGLDLGAATDWPLIVVDDAGNPAYR